MMELLWYGLQDLGVTAVDLLLIHWPTSTAPSADPMCNTAAPTYDAKECRLSTWRAYLEIFKSGKARFVPSPHLCSHGMRERESPSRLN